MSNKQVQTGSRTTVLAMAVAGVLAVTQIAGAQHRVDRSGANDANPRVGSNGRNEVRSQQMSPWQLNNAIIYGNVTGGKQFRDSVQSRDPREFRGTTAGRNLDNFVRDSSGVTTGGIATFNANQTRAYYGDSRGVAPPPGFTGVQSLGGYTAPQPSAWRQVDPRLQPVSAGTTTMVLRPDAFGGPGAVDTQFAPGAVVVPPTGGTGAQQGVNPALLSDYTLLNRTSASVLSPDALSDLRTLDQNAPLTVGGVPQPSRNAAGETSTSTLNNTLLSPSALSGASTNDALAEPSVSNTLPQQQTVEPGIRSQIVGMAEQSSVYGNLVARKAEQEQAKRPGQANEEAARAFNEQLRKREAEAKAAAGKDQPKPGKVIEQETAPRPEDNKPDTGAKPAEQPKPDAGAVVPGNVAPLKVGSLAGAGGSKGLNDLLARAESQMREGKYASAIESYDAAETVTPGNSLVKLGRAHAELGGQYYRRAEASLRKTLSADKNLLAGQYDLKGMIGEQRLTDIEKDLRELLEKNPNDVGFAVLLAYIYYNTGDERRAAAQLDIADKRAGGKDEFVKLLKQSWTLPPTGAPTDNK